MNNIAPHKTNTMLLPLVTGHFTHRSRSSVCSEHMWNTAHLQCVFLVWMWERMHIYQGRLRPQLSELAVSFGFIDVGGPNLGSKGTHKWNHGSHNFEILWFTYLCKLGPFTYTVHRQQIVEDRNLLGGNQCDDKGDLSTYYVPHITQMFTCYLYVTQKSTVNYILVCLV